MITEAPRRGWWTATVIVALAMIAALTMLRGVPGQIACDGGVALDPILRFEWMTSHGEMATLFGTNPCATRLALAMDAVNRIDVMAFIPAFTLFQILGAMALRPRGRWLALFAINMAIIAAGCDLLEDRILFSLSLMARTGDVPDPIWFAQLFWFVRVKFALLALVAMILGWLVSNRAGRGGRAAGSAMIGGGLIALAGLASPALLGLGIGAAWITLLIVAIISLAKPQLL